MAVACMRWQPGRVQTWRRAEDGGFDGRRYEVAAIGERQARAYVEDRHYSGTWVAARLRYGLMDVSGREPRLAGVAVLSVPVSKRAVLKVFPDLIPFLNQGTPSTHWCCMPRRGRWVCVLPTGSAHWSAPPGHRREQVRGAVGAAV